MKKIFLFALSFILILSTCDKQKQAETYDLIPLVNIDGVLYLDTGLPADDPNTLDYDGQITSQVDGSLRPTKHAQSNFGTGYDYLIVDEGVIAIKINHH